MSWLITPQQKNKGLLDQFSGAAAAYSLRDLTFLRGGPVVRVRRSSDNTEADFTAAQVSDGTLTTFCGAGNGFVRTWYDQSGNGLHGEQATTANQPQIVSSGSIITAGSLQTLQFNGSTQFLFLPVGALNWERTQAFTFFAVANIASQNGIIIAKQQGSGSSTGWAVNHFTAATNPPGFNLQLRNTSLNQAWRYATGSYNTNTVYEAVYKGDSSATNIELAFNGVNQSGTNQADTLSASILNNVQATIGSRENGSVPLNGKMAELILYPSVQSSGNRAGINANINAHYAIY